MGTNYYATVGTAPYCPNPCEHCRAAAQSPVPVHIGKQSAGWKFLFRRYPSLDTFAKWADFLRAPNVTIQDEYGSIEPAEEFLRWVQEIQANPRTKPHKGGDHVSDAEGYDFAAYEFC